MGDDKQPGPTTVFDQRGWEVSGDVYNVNGDLILTENSTREDFSHALADLKSEISQLNDLPTELKQQVSQSLEQAAKAAELPQAEKDSIVECLDTAKDILDSVKNTVDGARKIAKTIKKIGGWVAAFFI